MLDAALQAVPRVRRTDPGTSHEAAIKAGSLAKNHQNLVLGCLVVTYERHGEPMGAEQIGKVIGMEAYAVRKRTSELHQAGLIRPVGERKTSTGRTERTWKPVP